MNEGLKLLTLGEGDFSFSLSFCKTLRKNPTKATSIFNHFFKEKENFMLASKVYLTATSYDSLTELPEKYPDSKQILNQLNSFEDVNVLHRVNAWELEDLFPNESFDTILWNHPHLGVESFKLHKYLMSHFLHSSQKVLKPGGVIIISLIEGQAERWQLIDQARKHNLELLIKRPFEVKEWAGYTTRRNRNGKSFTNAHTQKTTGSEMKSFTYLFIRSEDKKHISLRVERVKKSTESKLLDNERALESYSSKSSDITNNVSIGEKIDQLYHKNTKINDALINNNFYPKIFKPVHECQSCFKKFNTSQGLNTHVQQVHIYEKYGSNWTPDRPRTVECLHCLKKFPDEEAMWQHSISIHRQVSNITPNNSNTNQSSNDENESVLNQEVDAYYNYGSEITSLIKHYDYYPCPVCGLAVPENWGISQHLETLKPILNLKLKCEICNKEFIETRALIQHWKFCFEKFQKQDLTI